MAYKRSFVFLFRSALFFCLVSFSLCRSFVFLCLVRSFFFVSFGIVFLSRSLFVLSRFVFFVAASVIRLKIRSNRKGGLFDFLKSFLKTFEKNQICKIYRESFKH